MPKSTDSIKEKLESRNDIIKYIFEQKNMGKSKDEIFEDLVDNLQVNNVFARSTVESIRWEENK